MKHVFDPAQEPDRPRSIDELRCRFSRRLSNMRNGWTRCDNRLCKRRKYCCGEGPVFTCTDDGRPKRELSEEEKGKRLSELYHWIKARQAERYAGVERPDPETPRKPRQRARHGKAAQARANSPRRPGERRDP
jgi:hypothetical protein